MISRSRGPELYGGVLSTFFLQYVLSTSHLNKQTNKKMHWNTLFTAISLKLQYTSHVASFAKFPWVPDPGSEPEFLSVELGFRILIFSGIPDSLVSIQEFKDQGFRIPQAKISRFRGSGFPYTGRYGTFITVQKTASEGWGYQMFFQERL